MTGRKRWVVSTGLVAAGLLTLLGAAAGAQGFHDAQRASGSEWDSLGRALVGFVEVTCGLLVAALAFTQETRRRRIAFTAVGALLFLLPILEGSVRRRAYAAYGEKLDDATRRDLREMRKRVPPR